MFKYLKKIVKKYSKKEKKVANNQDYLIWMKRFLEKFYKKKDKRKRN
jgi:hypothetical protein